MGKTWGGGKAYWTNNWDFPEDDRKDFSECFENKIKPQVKEILTKYGEICMLSAHRLAMQSAGSGREYS